MTCYKPLTAYRTPGGSITFNEYRGYKDIPLQLPCGQCIGCRLERSRQWAVRCVHEAQMHENNCFITLTYDNDHLPNPPTLILDHFQKFMKRLRFHTNKKIRFYHCGEYGDKNRRPHYHAIIFGHDFDDKKLWQTRKEIKLYTSEILEGLWQKGFATVGDATFDSAAYCARYIMKKQTGKGSEKHYEHICPTTGEITQLKPEYTTMSRRPGIGKPWLDKYQTDVYPSDEVIINGKITKPPKFYDNQYENMEKIKTKRQRRATKQKENNTPERLLVREKIKQTKINQLPRNI